MLRYEQNQTFDMKAKLAVGGERLDKTCIDEIAPSVRWLNFKTALDFAKTRRNINELEVLKKFFYHINIHHLLVLIIQVLTLLILCTF